MELYNCVSLIGVAGLIGLSFLCSQNRKTIAWKTVIICLGVQLLIACCLFILPAGTRLLLWVNDAVSGLVQAASAGSRFLFGALADPTALATDEQSGVGFILAFQALPTIIFFSALMAILYFYKVLTVLIKFLSRGALKSLSLSGVESLCAVSNFFVGIESVFTIRPFLPRLTNSEVFLVLTTGMSTIASNVLALYVFQLQGTFSNIAGHLVSASLLSVPAAIVIAKIMVPETERPDTLGRYVDPHLEQYDGVFEAIIDASMQGVKLIVGIAALLVAVLGLIALADQLLNGVVQWLGKGFGLSVSLTLSDILSAVAYPLTLLIGVPVEDAPLVARLIGQRVILTEVASYQALSTLLANDEFVHPRSPFLASYALCGFAHFASLAIFSGGITAIAPKHKKTLNRLGLKALMAATLACLLTAAVAGTFFTKSSILLTG
jgi:CNT family concentrative nucleoside transporter